MLLEMDKITKMYGGFTANRSIDFQLREGEIHALVGENGAGKTTLMRMLYGMEQPTSGTIRVRGREVSISSPSQAMAHGIGMVHQHFMLFPSFTVAENIVIGREPAKAGAFDRKQRCAACARIGATIQHACGPVEKSRRMPAWHAAACGDPEGAVPRCRCHHSG